MIWEIKNLLRRFVGRQAIPNPTKVAHTADVRKALAQPNSSMPGIQQDSQLTAFVERAQKRPVTLSSRELFSLNGHPLPCWREEDVGAVDNWLTSDDYYPLYYRLFQELSLHFSRPRMLEIGVRTGYAGVAFARGIKGPRTYIGVDPNLYLPDGLDRARKTFKELRSIDRDFEFNCLFGYSENPRVQKQLRSLAPFDIIHIDGDHTMPGKLVDLELCHQLINSSGFVLVDDYYYIPDVVQEAVGRAFNLGWYSKYCIVNTFRGMALLQK